jgi:thiamine pyrophosphate-dependent acetolactate synthase large subunit-like protein
MGQMTGGEAAIATLAANGVQLAFGMPGMHNLALYDALLDRPEFHHILIRNEQAGSMMANAVGRATGRPGICVVTTGPAACNALTGVADGARESVPMLVLASQISSHLIGQNKGAFHEMLDQRGVFAAAGAFAARANRVEQVPAVINAAWVAMTHGRPRPAYVEIPEDILLAEGDVEVSAAPAAPRPAGTGEQYARVLEMLQAAERPLVYVGAGAARSGAGAELVSLIERFNLPVVSTINGKGVVPEDHLLSAGTLPIGDPTCKALFARADLLLALGTSFSQVSTGFWTMRYPARLIHVDIDGAQIGRNVPAALGIVGDVRTVLCDIDKVAAAQGLGHHPAPDWVREVTSLPRQMERRVEGSSGAEIAHTLRRLLDRDAVMVGDAQGWAGWTIYHFPTFGGGNFFYPIHFGTLGYSVAGAIGVQAALPERQVVAVCGDGGFLYCSNELATAVQHNLNILVLVVNNSSFASVRAYQERRYGADRAFATDLQNPDLVAYARAFGCFGRRVNAPAEFEPALAAALDARRPAVLEVAFPLPPSPGDYGLGSA